MPQEESERERHRGPSPDAPTRCGDLWHHLPGHRVLAPEVAELFRFSHCSLFMAPPPHLRRREPGTLLRFHSCSVLGSSRPEPLLPGEVLRLSGSTAVS